MDTSLSFYIKAISEKLGIPGSGVSSVINLTNEGATIPFIARYRKEATGSLDETVISEIRKLYEEYQELDKRKSSILKNLEERGILNKELEKEIETAVSLIELEDVYQPYKQKKRTRASIARDKGLEPLAKTIFNQENISIEEEAENYIDDDNGLSSIDEVLTGARDIIAEWISEDVDIKNQLRNQYRSWGNFVSKVVKAKKDIAHKFEDDFDFSENVRKITAHRILAVLRGKSEGFLTVKVSVDDEKALNNIKRNIIKRRNSASEQVGLAIEDSYKRLLHPSIENELIKELKDRADDESIEVFSRNLRELLLQSPLGSKNIMAMDPGFRTGVKVVCLNSNGDLIHNDTIYPHNNRQSSTDEAVKKVRKYCTEYKIEAIGIGNGTAGRETETFVRSLGLNNIIITMVNESGASIYSASEIARKEFPDHDITVRGAVSIGRRLMDPLAELVKIDPKSIGVGQYQHDVDQGKLKKSLTFTVESCVNSVGVEINTASEKLLEYVSGVGPILAKNIIDYRSNNGHFKSRNDLKKVARLGAGAFQQSAGFIRVRESKNVLDKTAVHPESYCIVKKMSSDLNVSVDELINSEKLRKEINIKDYETETVGLPTLNDIMAELEKPGRDPRENFEIFKFNEEVNSIEDLKIGMKLPGIVTNVTNFGAFVDIGVHQDGLVHISQLADRYVSDPNDIVKVNQKVNVSVMDIDLKKRRISLSMKEK